MTHADERPLGAVVEFRGVPDDITERMSPVTDEILSMARELGYDLSSLRRIILADDYAATLDEVRTGQAFGGPLRATVEDYAVGVAMALPVAGENGASAMVLVVNAKVACSILGGDRDHVRTIAGLFIHELAHVHDHGIKSAVMARDLATRRHDQKEAALFATAEQAWGEYCACRLSVLVDPAQASHHADIFRAAITTAPNKIRLEISEYSGDVERLWSVAHTQVHWMFQSAAYLLGCLDGLDATLADLAPDVEIAVANSQFAVAWSDMQEALRAMWQKYPIEWEVIGVDVYQQLMDIVESFYETQGVGLEMTERGLWIGILS